MKNNNIVNGGGRLEYIDTMKGFIMLIVVYWHVCGQFQVAESHIRIILTSFAVPLFYFISGYLGFKVHMDTSLCNVKRCIVAKFNTLFIPAVLFIIITCAYKNKIYITTNYGFILALFLMFFVLYMCQFLVKKNRAFDIIYLMVGGSLLFLGFVQKQFHIMQDDTPIVSIIMYGITFYPYFMLGVFAKKRNALFDRCLNNDILITLLLLFYGISFFMFHTILKKSFPADGMLLGVSGTLITYKFFKNYQTLFSNNYIGAWFRYVGRKTMDVFCLHWFFLISMPEVSNILNKYHLQQFEFVFVVLYAILIVLLCLGLSKILCLSNILEKRLFGRAKPII